MAKLVSRKDGKNGCKATSFDPYIANTYDVVSDDGFILGSFSQLMDRDFNFKTTCWIGMRRKFQYLKQAREFVKGL